MFFPKLIYERLICYVIELISMKREKSMLRNIQRSQMGENFKRLHNKKKVIRKKKLFGRTLNQLGCNFARHFIQKSQSLSSHIKKIRADFNAIYLRENKMVFQAIAITQIMLPLSH